MHNGLPAGWRVTNSGGSWSAPARDDEGDDIALDEGLEPEDLRPDSPGWEDVEPEESEEVRIKSLFDDVYSSSFEQWQKREIEEHRFDFGGVCRDHKLGFYGAVKLINYIRSQVAAGNPRPDTCDHALWQDDKFMKPVLEDDALISSLYDVEDLLAPEDDAALAMVAGAAGDSEGDGHREVAKMALA